MDEWTHSINGCSRDPAVAVVLGLARLASFPPTPRPTPQNAVDSLRTNCNMIVLISDGLKGSRMPSMSALRSCSTNSITMKIWLTLSPTTISSTLTMLGWLASMSV